MHISVLKHVKICISHISHEIIKEFKVKAYLNF